MFFEISPKSALSPAYCQRCVKSAPDFQNKENPCALSSFGLNLVLDRNARLFKKVFQALAAAGMAELTQGLGLNLADALARDVELLADLFQRSGLAVVQAIAQAEHLGLARRQRIQYVHKLLLEQRYGNRLRRRGRVVIGYKVAEVAVVLLADGCFQRDMLLRDFDNLTNLVL